MLPTIAMHGGANTLFSETERRRRSSVLKLGLMACFAMLLIDSIKNGNEESHGLRGVSSKKKDYETISKNDSALFTERLFTKNYTTNIPLLNDDSVTDNADISGVFRGEWVLESSGNSTAQAKGRMLMQLKSVVIKNLDQLRYVYGVIRIYASTPASITGDMLIPVQGVIETATSHLTLLTTPQKTQFIAITPLGQSGGPGGELSTSSSALALATPQATNGTRRLQFKYDPQGAFFQNLKAQNKSDLFVFDRNATVDPFNESALYKKILGTVLPPHTALPSVRQLKAPLGASTQVQVSREEIDSIFNGDVAKRRGVPLGVDVLTDNFHALQDQANVFVRRNTFTECFSDATMQFSLGSNAPEGFGTGTGPPHPISNSAHMSGLIQSWNCQQLLNMTSTVLYIHFDELEKKAEVYGALATLVYIAQIVLVVMQMKHSAAQAGFGKISTLCICAQAVQDALVCIGHLMLCAAVPTVFFFHFIWVAILSLLLFSVFEMKTVINIYQTRHAGDDWTAMRRRLTGLQTRFYCSLFLAMACVFVFQAYPIILVFLLYSVWVPQIVHSARSGGKKPLLNYYYLGTGLCRLYMPMYILGCPDNIFSRIDETFAVSYSAGLILVLWTLAQLLLLYLQDRLGPRFFIPRSWLPEQYDYCRPVSSTSGCDRECTICYTDVDVSGREYMVTPCDHLFHQPCLTQWIDIKLECPVCRSVLPAVD